jgi:hypothetical protein
MQSCFQKIAEATDKLSPAQFTQFKEARQLAASRVGHSLPAEVTLNILNSVLKGDNTHRESVKKNNGAADNGRVSEFRESASGGDGGERSETDPILAEAYKLCEQYVKFHGLSEADARKVVGLPQKKRSETQLSEAAYRVFCKLTMAGKSERDALATAAQTAISD